MLKKKCSEVDDENPYRKFSGSRKLKSVTTVRHFKIGFPLFGSKISFLFTPDISHVIVPQQ